MIGVQSKSGGKENGSIGMDYVGISCDNPEWLRFQHFVEVVYGANFGSSHDWHSPIHRDCDDGWISDQP